jgi:hypothetical protein
MAVDYQYVIKHDFTAPKCLGTCHRKGLTMKSRKTLLALLGAALAGVIALVAQPAIAAISNSTDEWTVGGVNYGIEENGGFFYTSTPSFSNYAWYSEYSDYFYGGGFSGYAYAGRCNPNTATAVTESNGDVVVTCEPDQMSPTDVWITHSYRMFADQKLARHTFSLDNRGATTLTGLNNSANNIGWELNEDDLQSSSGNLTSCANMTSSDNWLMAANSSNSTIAAFAWQAAGGNALDFSGDCSDGYQEAEFVKTHLGAGEKVTYMTVLATGEPEGTSAGAMTTAFDAFKTQMVFFDSLNETLCRGIDDGTAIEGWGTCTGEDSGPVEELAKTGADSEPVGLLLTLGGLVLAVGLVARYELTRRNAQR